MRNKKMKKLIVTGVLIMLISIILVSCKKSEEVNQNIEEQTPVELEDSFVEPEETEPEFEEITMFFTGDVMIQRVTGLYDSKGINGIISEYLEEEMVSADMTMINNEFPFSTRGSQHPDKQFTFRVNPDYVQMLLDMGVDVASLANNHALDYGVDALSDSFTTLDGAGISYVGAGETKERAEEAIFIEIGGRKIGILSASRVIPVVEWNIDNRQPGLLCTYDSTRLVQRIQEIEEECDYTIVFVHWGIERKAYPEEYQHDLAKQYIDAGADLVVGNHSHVPQGIEYYKDVPIVYCMGNYIFNDDMPDTYATKVTVDVEGNTSLQIIPIDTKSYLTSELTGEEAQAFYDYLEEISFNVSIDDSGVVLNEEN